MRLIIGTLFSTLVFLCAAVCQVPAIAQDAAVVEAPPETDDMQSLFNGTDLDGWDGDERLWEVTDGVIRGETTADKKSKGCLLYTSPSPRDATLSRMPSSA